MPAATASAPLVLEPWAEAALRLLAWSGERAVLGDDARARLLELAPEALPGLARRNVDSLHYLACEPEAPRQRLYDAVWEVQRAALAGVLAALEADGVPALVFKGAETVPKRYGSRALGFMADVDVLVPRADAARARELLFGLGYTQSAYDAAAGRLVRHDVAAVAEQERSHYELMPFSRLDPAAAAVHAELEGWEPLVERHGERHVVVTVDVHHAIATDVPSDELFERAEPSALGRGLTLSPADQLWVLGARYWTEVSQHRKTSLRDLAYLAPLVADPDLDWNVVVDAAARHELRSSLYYAVAFLGTLTGREASADVLEELSPLHGSRYRDCGWQVGKLFGFVEPPPPFEQAVA